MDPQLLSRLEYHESEISRLETEIRRAVNDLADYAGMGNASNASAFLDTQADSVKKLVMNDLADRAHNHYRFIGHEASISRLGVLISCLQMTSSESTNRAPSAYLGLPRYDDEAPSSVVSE